MWSKKKGATSDNRYQEYMEDCGCSSSSAETVKFATQSYTENVDGNLQKTLPTEEKTPDSGIFSGPQTSNSDSCDIKGSELEVKKQNNSIASETLYKSLSPHKENHQDEWEEDIFDSGCIQEDNDISKSNNITNNQNTSTSTNKSTSESSKVILNNNVASDVTQRFSNLSFHETSTITPSINESPGISINNLNIPKKENTSSQQQRSSTEAVSVPPTLLSIWEQFYDQDDDGNTPLHKACFWGETDLVAALIRITPHSCLLNIRNDAVQTPLHLATLSLQSTILRMLLFAGAEPSIRDSCGNTALHLACKASSKQCVESLTRPFTSSEINELDRKYRFSRSVNNAIYLHYVRLPPDMEIRNYEGENYVHLAAQYGNIDILNILVLNGADINAREGKAGRTCLHMAVINSNEELANFLMFKCEKLDKETPMYARLTAFQLAKLLNKTHMASLLERNGAKSLSPPESDSDCSDSEGDPDEELFCKRFGNPDYIASFKDPNNTMTVV